MKTYLAKFSIIEGEHTYDGAFLLHASHDKQAFEIAIWNEHEPEIRDDSDGLAFWDFGDGTTASRVKEVIEITEEEAAMLQRLGLAFYFNLKNTGEIIPQQKKLIQNNHNTI